jgi:hypothetical protein
MVRFIEENTLTFTDIRRDPSEEIVILKGTSRSNKPADWLEYVDTPETIRLRDDLRELNDFVESVGVDMIDPADPTKDTFHDHEGRLIDTSAVRMRRYFNRESLHLGGRMFGGFWQTMPKHLRRFLVIDGEHVADLDFTGMSYNLLYAHIGKVAPPGDPYALDGLVRYRDGCKAFMTAMLNKEEPPRALPKATAKLLPEGMTHGRMLELLERKHPAIMPLLFPGRDQPYIGLTLMRLESEIILRVLLDLKDHGVVGLNMHDGVMVPESAERLTEVLMTHHAWDVARAVLRVVRKEVSGAALRLAA